MTEKEIHWLGELAQAALLAGCIYLGIRLADGRSYHPTIAMPVGVRILALAALLAVFASFRTHRYYRKKRGSPVA